MRVGGGGKATCIGVSLRDKSWLIDYVYGSILKSNNKIEENKINIILIRLLPNTCSNLRLFPVLSIRMLRKSLRLRPNCEDTAFSRTFPTHT